MIDAIITTLVSSAGDLLNGLGTVFTEVFSLIYDDPDLTTLGVLIVAVGGFALAYSGIRFVFGFINRLLGKARGGGR